MSKFIDDAPAPLNGGQRLQILFLSRWFPYPPDNGSRIRILNLLRALSGYHTVDLISFVNQSPSESSMATVRQLCRNVEAVQHVPFDPGRLQAMAGLLSAKPRSVVATNSKQLRSLVDRYTGQNRYDVIVASEIDMAPYVPAGATPAIFEELELTTLFEQYQRAKDPLRRARYGLTWWKLRCFLAERLQRFAACTVVSEPELARFRHAVPSYRGRSAVIPNGVDVAHYEGYPGTPQPDTMIYSGAVTYRANYDAVDYFGREILPLIREQRPNAELLVTGNPGPINIEPLSRPGVRFAGYLPDVRPALAQSWVSVIPLRYGGGTRLKLLESLAIGTPVIATPKGAEGLALEAGRDLLIAERPADFAATVLRVLSDGQLRSALASAGSQVARTYDWGRIGTQYRTLVESVASQTDEHATMQARVE